MRPDHGVRVLLALAALSIANGCARDPAGVGVRDPLIPLTIGATWDYTITDSVEFGTPPSREGLPPRTARARVVRDTTVARERWGVIEDHDEVILEVYSDVYFLTSRRDGMHLWVGDDESFPLVGLSRGVLVYRFPARTGDQGPFWDPWVVTATDTVVTVPAGSFRTIRYDLSGGTTSFIAPGVGVVKKVGSRMSAYDAEGQLLWHTRMVYQLTQVTGVAR